MPRYRQLNVWLLVSVCCTVLLVNRGTSSAASPNVLLVLADDPEFGGVQLPDNRLIKTPHHDWIEAGRQKLERRVSE